MTPPPDASTIQDRIQRHPKFHELVRRRTRLAVGLSLTMLAIYFGFVLLVAYAPELLGASLSGGVTTVGIPVGVFVIFSAFVLTGIYVVRANTTFDRLTEELLKEVA